MLVQAGVTRAQEREADLVSIRVAGKAAVPARCGNWHRSMRRGRPTGTSTSRGASIAAPRRPASRHTSPTCSRPARSTFSAASTPSASRPAGIRTRRSARVWRRSRPWPNPTRPCGRRPSSVRADPRDARSARAKRTRPIRSRNRDVVPFDEYVRRAGQFSMQQRADRLYRGAGRLAHDDNPASPRCFPSIRAVDTTNWYGRRSAARRTWPDSAIRAMSIGSSARDAVRGAMVDSGVAGWDVSWSDGVRLVGRKAGLCSISEAVDACTGVIRRRPGPRSRISAST